MYISSGSEGEVVRAVLIRTVGGPVDDDPLVFAPGHVVHRPPVEEPSTNTLNLENCHTDRRL